jgi:hypothetical protein
MTKARSIQFGLALLAPIALATPAPAKVLSFEVLKVEPAFAGESFGAIGAYEKVTARATIGVDPADPRNAGIVDLALAPRGASGLVEATSEVEILRPVDGAKANGSLLYEAVNRGRKLGVGLFDDAPQSNALGAAADAGNGFLMRQGYTIVWSGWQGDVPAGEGRLTVAVPVVPGVTGFSREEWVFDTTTNPAVASLTYPATDLDPAHARLTVREREADARASPADLQFAFVSPTRISVTRPQGFDAGAIYELVYTAKDPMVLGLGFAATRDVVAFLRHDAGARNPLAQRAVRHAIGFGVSQSGRFVRDFLYQGFNADEAGRVVFDGVMPHVAGGKKTFVNYRFGQPGRHTQQHADHNFPGDQFPFTYPVLDDPVSFRRDGILAKCLAERNCPKVIQSDTQLEIYQSRAALVVTDPSGAAIALPDNVRVYYLANLPHFAAPGGAPAAIAACERPSNPLHAGMPMRALLAAMEEWLRDGKAPPASRYPSRADGTLVEPKAEAVGFPAIPGFTYAGLVNRPTLVDHAAMPPLPGAAYPVFVGKADRDGHDLAGIRLPQLEAPVATYLGWNHRKEGFAKGELCDLIGSTLPLAKTRAERTASGDSRLSLEERYATPTDYVGAVAKAAKALVADRLLLDEDAARLIAAAEQGGVEKASR